MRQIIEEVKSKIENEENLNSAIDEVLNNPKYREKALWWKEELERRNYGGAERVVEIIEKLVG